MSYADATAFAASLATTLMVSIVVFQAGDGTHAACPAAEFDGDDDMVKLEMEPVRAIRSRADGSGPKRPGLQPQSPSAISRATMARAFIITSSPEVSI